jgi:DNA-binding transcriptional ArsR family regulator
MKQAFTDQFRAIADPGRREILQLLSRDSLTINALADNFDMSRPAVSKHIKILYSAGLIMIEDIGRERRCALRKEGFTELQQWINYFDKFWNNKLDALGKFLEDDNRRKKKRTKS